MVWQARLGKARRGPERQGRKGMVRQVADGLGELRHGKVGQSGFVGVRRCEAVYGLAWSGKAVQVWSGKASLVGAGYGAVWQARRGLESRGLDWRGLERRVRQV